MQSTNQIHKSSNVLRVFLSSNDRIAGSSINNPSFNISLQNQIGFWDTKRPVYFMIESLMYPTNPSYVMLGLCWTNMPLLNRQLVVSNPNHNGLVYLSEGLDQMRTLSRNSIGYPLTVDSLMALSTFTFQFEKHDGTVVADADIGSAFWFNMVFYQDE